ncbi:MAG: hypothetical protein R3D28_12565 [Geminicoccaceae bacterium]
MKLESSVVTTSSTPKRAGGAAGPSIQSASCQGTRHHDQRQQQETRDRDEAGADRDRGAEGAEISALGADVPQARPEGDGGGEARQNQGAALVKVSVSAKRVPTLPASISR